MKEASKCQVYREHGEIALLNGPPLQASRHVHSEMLEMDHVQCHCQYTEQ